MIAPILGTDDTGAVTRAQSRASVSREQFLQILVSELTSQNPLEPMDNSQLVQQLVGLQSLEQTAALTDSLKTFERFLQMTSGSALIGKKVTGQVPGGERVQGVVSKVVMENNLVHVVVGTQKLPVNAVSEIVGG